MLGDISLQRCWYNSLASSATASDSFSYIVLQKHRKPHDSTTDLTVRPGLGTFLKFNPVGFIEFKDFGQNPGFF